MNTLVLHLWGSNAGPPLFLMHFGFGVGGLAAPLLATPFLTDQQETSLHANVSSYSVPEVNISEHWTEQRVNVTPVTVDASDALPTTSLPVLFYPYTIIGLINALCSIALFGFFVAGVPRGFPKHTQKTPLKKLLSPRTCAPRHPAYAAVLLTLLLLIFMQFVGAELIYGNFIFSFATDAQVSFDKESAALLSSLFWFSHMSGRFIGAMLEFCVPTAVILWCDCILLLVTTILLAFLGYRNEIALWVLTACFGCLISPLYPATMVWANDHLNVNAMSTMVLVAGSSTGLLVYVYIAGYMLEYLGPNSIMYFLVFCASGVLVVYAALTVIGKRYLRIVKLESQKVDALINDLPLADLPADKIDKS